MGSPPRPPPLPLRVLVTAETLSVTCGSGRDPRRGGLRWGWGSPAGSNGVELGGSGECGGRFWGAQVSRGSLERLIWGFR